MGNRIYGFQAMTSIRNAGFRSESLDARLCDSRAIPGLIWNHNPGSASSTYIKLCISLVLFLVCFCSFFFLYFKKSCWHGHHGQVGETALSTLDLYNSERSLWTSELHIWGCGWLGHNLIGLWSYWTLLMTQTSKFPLQLELAIHWQNTDAIWATKILSQFAAIIIHTIYYHATTLSMHLLGIVLTLSMDGLIDWKHIYWGNIIQPELYFNNALV